MSGEKPTVRWIMSSLPAVREVELGAGESFMCHVGVHVGNEPFALDVQLAELHAHAYARVRMEETEAGVRLEVFIPRDAMTAATVALAERMLKEPAGGEEL